MGQVSDDVEGYFDTRLAYDRRREVLWQTLCRHVFQPYVPPGGHVLELGAGWCDFINNIEGGRRIAVDIWPGITDQVGPGVEALVQPATSIPMVADGSMDVVFASNFLEHLHHEEIAEVLAEATRVLRPGGALILVQPNFRLCPGRYFDDYTHVSVWSDVGLAGFLEANGFDIELNKAKFLPFTVKSRLPVRSWLIRAYLASPIKPGAGQMLLVARPRPGV